MRKMKMTTAVILSCFAAILATGCDDPGAINASDPATPWTASQAQTYEMLAETSSFKFHDVDLETVMAYFNNEFGGKMLTAWPVLDDAGVYPSTMVNLRLDDVSRGRALLAVLETMGASEPLAYAVGSTGMVVIMPKAALLNGQAGPLKLATPPSDPDAQTVTEEKLNKTYERFEFNEVDLGTELEYLRTVSGANILVRWPELAAAGVDGQSLVSLKLLDSPTLTEALAASLDSAADDGVLMAIVDDDGVVVISTTSDLISGD